MVENASQETKTKENQAAQGEGQLPNNATHPVDTPRENLDNTVKRLERALGNRNREFETLQKKLGDIEEGEKLKRGEHESIILNLKQELEHIKKEHERFAIESKLENSLISAGASNSYFRKGLINEYLSMQDKPAIEEFLEVQLNKEENKVFLGKIENAPKPLPSSTSAKINTTSNVSDDLITRAKTDKDAMMELINRHLGRV